MKYRAIFFGILGSIIFVLSNHAQQDDFPVLIGPYLGQKPPGMTPEAFAPGIVSTDSHEFACCFSPVMRGILDLRICSSVSEIQMLSDLPTRRRVS